jgi:hypothetical protein
MNENCIQGIKVPHHQVAQEYYKEEMVVDEFVFEEP